MFKLLLFCVILLNGSVVFCDECTEPRTPEFWEMIDEATCCNFPNITDDDDDDDDFGLKCVQELKLTNLTDSQIEGNKTVGCMLTECMLTKVKFYSDGKVVMTEITKEINDMFKGYPPWIKLVTEIADKCVKDGVAKETEIRKKASEPPYNINKSCNSALSYITTCVSIQLVVQCPVASQIKSPTCDKGREILKKCPEQYFAMLAAD